MLDSDALQPFNLLPSSVPSFFSLKNTLRDEKRLIDYPGLILFSQAKVIFFTKELYPTKTFFVLKIHTFLQLDFSSNLFILKGIRRLVFFSC
jgi:hypothetical protein